MRTKYNRLIPRVWGVVTVSLLVASLWLPMITQSGQPFDELLALVGCGMALAGCALYPRSRVIK